MDLCHKRKGNGLVSQAEGQWTSVTSHCSEKCALWFMTSCFDEMRSLVAPTQTRVLPRPCHTRVRDSPPPLVTAAHAAAAAPPPLPLRTQSACWAPSVPLRTAPRAIPSFVGPGPGLFFARDTSTGPVPLPRKPVAVEAGAATALGRHRRSLAGHRQRHRWRLAAIGRRLAINRQRCAGNGWSRAVSG